MMFLMQQTIYRAQEEIHKKLNLAAYTNLYVHLYYFKISIQTPKFLNILTVRTLFLEINYIW